MASAGTISLVLLIFGPVAFRKVKEWQARRKQTGERNKLEGKRISSRLPLPLTLPSNVLVLLAFVTLIVYHVSALLLPSRYAMRTDLFLLLKQPINTSTIVLRQLLNDEAVRARAGWLARWTDEGLTTLVRRLSSWEGRKTHLLIGIDPFITCGFCDSTRDYIYYSVATRIAQYGVDLFLLGILTLRFDALNTLDDVLFLILQLTTNIDFAPAKLAASGQSTSVLRSHRFHWRATVKYFMAAFAICELAILSGTYEFGISQGRASHWHANRNIVWHCSIPLLACFILLSPRMPHVPALVQIVQSLQRTEVMNVELRQNLQAHHLSQQILWHDEEMRKHVANFHENAATYEDDTDETVERLARHAQAARVDIAQLRTQSRQAAHSVWLNSERVWSQRTDA